MPIQMYDITGWCARSLDSEVLRVSIVNRRRSKLRVSHTIIMIVPSLEAFGRVAKNMSCAGCRVKASSTTSTTCCCWAPDERNPQSLTLDLLCTEKLSGRRACCCSQISYRL